DPLVMNFDFSVPAWQRDLDHDGLRLGVAKPIHDTRRPRCPAGSGTPPGARTPRQSNHHRLGSDRGSPNHGSTLLSKRVMAQIRSPARVSTYRPVPWLIPEGVRR